MAVKTPVTEVNTINEDKVTVDVNIRAKRKYKNGSWAALDVITCGRCDIEKPRDAFKINRYVCMECSNAVLREHNKKKDTGKYSILQKEYNAKYEATAHGQERRIKYREKVTQLARESTEARRTPNIDNRLRIYSRQRMEKTLGSKLTVAAALQYLGISQPIFKSWMEYNFIDGMTWETLGTEWKPNLLESSGSSMLDERMKYDVFNWRNWAPSMNGSEARDCRERSINFVEVKSV
jgi:hypothetical protein